MNFLSSSGLKMPKPSILLHFSVSQNQYTLDKTSNIMKEMFKTTKRINSWDKETLQDWVSTEEEFNPDCTLESAREFWEHTKPGP